jgi:apolipoprotein N-acyltransferase
VSESSALSRAETIEPARDQAVVETISSWRRIWPWIAAFTTGLLLAGAFPPVDRGGLIWFALAPLVTAVWFSGSRRPGLLGYLAGLVFFTLTFHWLGALGVLFQAPLLYGLPLLLGAYLALYPAAWCWFLGKVLAPPGESRRFSNSWRNLGMGIVAASAWTLLEWVRGWLLGGFGWNSLGVALHRDLATMQIVELTGVPGLTWLVTFVNVMGVIVVRRIVGDLGPRFLTRIRWEFSITVALVVGVFAYGVRALSASRQLPAKTVRIAAVQPNIPQQQKFDTALEDEVFAQLERLTLPLAAFHPDIVLWPESATPRGLFADQTNFDFVKRIAADVRAPLLLGTVTSDADRGDYNCAMLVSSNGEELTVHDVYAKMRLVPFGEYLPLRPILDPIAGNLVPGDFKPGEKMTIFERNFGRFAALICFEDTAGDLTRRFVRDGAEALINITNDGWFLRTAGAEQHFANAVFRAVENRRPLVRCCNTGVTALVLPTGQVERWIQPHTQGGSIKPVSFLGGPLTFYTRMGNWWIWGCFFPVVLAIAFRLRARRKDLR